MELIYFVYGLGFIYLGLAILLQPKKDSSFAIGKTLSWLALFGITHGSKEWIDFWLVAQLPAPGYLQELGTYLLLISFLCLFEFGRQLAFLQKESWTVAQKNSRNPLLPYLIYIPFVTAFLMAVSTAENLLSAIDLWSRYLFGLSGSILAGWGVIRYYRNEYSRLGKLKLRGAFYLAGVAFLIYGIAGGLVVKSADIFPANYINTENFKAIFQFPVQVIRAACAVVLAIAFTEIIRIFHLESRDRLRVAADDAAAAYKELKAAGSQQQLILNSVQEAIFGVDIKHHITFINPAARALFGLGENFNKKKPIESILGLPEDHALITRISDILHNGAEASTLSAVIEVNQKTIDIEFTVAAIRHLGQSVGSVVTIRDISDQKAANETLRLAGLVLTNIPQGVLVTTIEGTIIYANHAISKTSGYSIDELVGKNSTTLRSTHHESSFYEELWRQVNTLGKWQGEIWNRNKNGDAYPEWLTIVASKDESGSVTHYIGIYADINTQQQVQERLHKLAYYDVLTGLPNRQLFKDRIDRVLLHSDRRKQNVAVLLIDLDRFKQINDAFGHSTGDQLLREVADRLKSSVRLEDTVCRLGGDEFSVVLSDLNNADHIGRIAEKVLGVLSQPFVVFEREFYVPGSIGISVYPADGKDPDTLIKNADTAMYRAKESGRNTYQFYSHDMSERSEKRISLEHDLRKAIEEKQFFLNYQPQVCADTGRVLGAEALVRWTHAERGPVSPLEFISIAEDIGLIHSLGEWVLRRACTDARLWVTKSNDNFTIAVNVSGYQLRKPNFAKLVKSILIETRLNPANLEIELTESALMTTQGHVANNLDELTELGVKLAIDDFGTGYSSLSYLKKLSVDNLKIDRSFVSDIPGDANDVVIATTIIAIGTALGLTITAEGVETEEQWQILKTQGCQQMQGYFFSKPVSADLITDLLTKAQPLVNRSANL